MWSSEQPSQFEDHRDERQGEGDEEQIPSDDQEPGNEGEEHPEDRDDDVADEVENAPDDGLENKLEDPVDPFAHEFDRAGDAEQIGFHFVTPEDGWMYAQPASSSCNSARSSSRVRG